MKEKIKSKLGSLGAVRSAIAAVLIVAIALTLVFIFSNSAKNQTDSSEQSDSFKEKVEKIIPADTPLGSAILDNIRKIAHFTEYGLLGIELSLLILVLSEERKNIYKAAPISLCAAFFTAFFDETVQIFSKRGPAIGDVWIDVGGFFTYALLTYGAFALFLLIKKAAKKIRKTPQGEKTD